MHHIALCTPCIAFLLVSHTCAFYVRIRGARTRGATEASTSGGHVVTIGSLNLNLGIFGRFWIT
jgi:hypothetical protein